MRVFIAGGTGVVGQHLIPMLTAAGHEVTATTRSPGKASLLRSLGATPAVVDGLDASAVREAVREASPAVIIHQMTSLATMGSLRHFDKEFAVTSELRTAGTDNLLAAARAVGAARFIAQSYFTVASFAGWPGLRGDGEAATAAGPPGLRPP